MQCILKVKSSIGSLYQCTARKIRIQIKISDRFHIRRWISVQEICIRRIKLSANTRIGGCIENFVSETTIVPIIILCRISTLLAGYLSYSADLRIHFVKNVYGYISQTFYSIELFTSVQSSSLHIGEYELILTKMVWSISYINVRRKSTFKANSVICRLSGDVSKWALPYIKFR